MIKIYTVEDICDYLKVSRNTVYILIQQGKLKTKKIGRSYKITESALDEFIKPLES